MIDALRTERLLLRQWRPDDRAPFAAINRDPDVMATLGRPLTDAESDALVERFTAEFDDHGFGLWALERLDTGVFIGFTGLSAHSTRATPVDGLVEVGWRLARAQWGNGFATEAARVSIADGFQRVGLDEIVSITAVVNTRSQAVMERIGMQRDHDADFLHPRVAEGDRLRPSVVYRLRRSDWVR